MKRTILMVAAVLALAACSKNENPQPNVNSGEIIFKVSADAAATKVAETDLTNLDEFYVSAYSATPALNTAASGNAFDNVKFTKTTTAAQYAGGQYWHLDASTQKIDSKLTFFAYAPSASDMGLTESDVVFSGNSTRSITGYAPATEIKDQKDVLVGAVSSVSGNGQLINAAPTVNLTLNHALSQIEVKVKNDGELKYTVAGVKIVGFTGKGNNSISAAGASTWTLSTDAADLNKTYETVFTTPISMPAAETSIMGADGNAMIIPQNVPAAWNPATPATTGAYIALNVKIEDAEGNLLFPKAGGDATNGCGWVAVGIPTAKVSALAASSKYSYVLDFTNGAGNVAPGQTYGTKNAGDRVLDSVAGPIIIKVNVGAWTPVAAVEIPMI